MPFRFLPSRWLLVAGLVSLVTMDGLLISGLLVIPCVSAGTLAISVGSKVILSVFERFTYDLDLSRLIDHGFDHGPCVILTHLSLPPVP